MTEREISFLLIGMLIGIVLTFPATIVLMRPEKRKG